MHLIRPVIHKFLYILSLVLPLSSSFPIFRQSSSFVKKSPFFLKRESPYPPQIHRHSKLLLHISLYSFIRIFSTYSRSLLSFIVIVIHRNVTHIIRKLYCFHNASSSGSGDPLSFFACRWHSPNPLRTSMSLR